LAERRRKAVRPVGRKRKKGKGQKAKVRKLMADG